MTERQSRRAVRASRGAASPVREAMLENYRIRAAGHRAKGSVAGATIYDGLVELLESGEPFRFQAWQCPGFAAYGLEYGSRYVLMPDGSVVPDDGTVTGASSSATAAAGVLRVTAKERG